MIVIISEIMMTVQAARRLNSTATNTPSTMTAPVDDEAVDR